MAKVAARIGVEIGAAFAGNFKAVFGSANAEIGKIGDTIARLEGKQAQLAKGIQTFGRMGKDVDGMRARYAAVTAEIDKARQAQERLIKAQARVNDGKAMMADAGLKIGAVTAAAATAGLPIVQAAAFEKAMVGVAKQVEGARDEGGKLTEVYFGMARQIQQLGREVPLATNEIADMVAAGARMGVARDELIDFTKTAAMMAFAFELPAGELADQMGKIAGLYKIPIPAIGELADTINYLDDNAISKGGDIIDFLTRTGGVAGSVKITGQQMAALGSTLLTLGERSETASTATNALIQKLAAGDKGSKGFLSAMDELGLSVDAVQKGLQVDAQGTILQVLTAIEKFNPDKRLGILTELIGLEHADTVAKLATNMGEYRKQIDMVSSGKAGGSMGREFAAQLQTTSAQWEIMKNRVTEISVNLGSVLLPAVNSVLSGIGSVTSAIADFVSGNQTLVGNLATVVATLGGVYAATQAWTLGLGALKFVIGSVSALMAANPIGLALTALAVAAVLLWKNWDGVKGGLVATWETIKETAIAAFDAIKSAVGSVIDWLAEKTAWIFEKVGKIRELASEVGGVIGGAWSGVKGAIGLGEGGSTTPSAASAPVAPAPVAAGGGGPRIQQTNSPQYNITVQGSATDPNATAKAIRDEMDRRERERAAGRRSMMSDSLGY